LLADDTIVVGGAFTSLGGQTRNYIGRLNPDGTLDTAFDPGANGIVFTLAVQADGKIVVGGYLGTLGGQTRNYIGRLNPDGTLDTSFNPGANGGVFAMAAQADGKIVVGGQFTALGGQTRNYIGRLSSDTAALQSLTANANGTAVTWTRSGAGPEVWRVTFESSTDGVSYAPLGAGTRNAGNWQLTSLALPRAQNVFIRARGYYATGYSNGSSSVVESVRNVFLKGDTTTTITSDSPDPSALGQAVSVNFSVTSLGGTPTGIVTVSDGVDSCTGTVATGTCELTLTTPGARTFTATYAGDASFNASSDTEPHQVRFVAFLPLVRR